MKDYDSCDREPTEDKECKNCPIMKECFENYRNFYEENE